MNPMNPILTLQISSLLITSFLALALIISKVHIKRLNSNYETSRWLLVVAMFIFSLHYLLQICFGFRAKGDDVGAAINILFYSPATFLLSFSIVSLSSREKYRQHYLWLGVASGMIILATFLTGWAVYHSLHMGIAVHIMGCEYFTCVAYAIIGPIKEVKKTRRRLESDTAGDLGYYNAFMYSGTMLLLLCGILIPIIIFMRPMLFAIGPVFLILLFVYIINFICLGFNLSPVAETLATTDNNETEKNVTDNELETIRRKIDEWVTAGGYANAETTLDSLARTIGQSAPELGHFIRESYDLTFRVWLSKIRINEAKRLLIEKPDENIEIIAEECGITSRSYFQNLFKAETGFTPREWRKNA